MVHRRKEILSQDNKERRKLTTWKWRCGTCGEDKPAAKYAHWKQEHMYDVIFEHVIAPGAMRTCQLCSELVKCQKCGKQLHQ